MLHPASSCRLKAAWVGWLRELPHPLSNAPHPCCSPLCGTRGMAAASSLPWRHERRCTRAATRPAARDRQAALSRSLCSPARQPLEAVSCCGLGGWHAAPRCGGSGGAAAAPAIWQLGAVFCPHRSSAHRIHTAASPCACNMHNGSRILQPVILHATECLLGAGEQQSAGGRAWGGSCLCCPLVQQNPCV